MVIFMSIYIHIPFCSSICTYCDFCKMYYNKKYIDRYLKCLKNEIEERYNGEEVRTIFFGGGTPTSLDEKEMVELLKLIKIFNISSDAEITVESNIESITEEKLKIMRDYGVNRLSIGIQSFNDDIIKILGRVHTKEEVFSKIKLIKRYFSNINIDLIYAVNNDINIVKEDIDNFLKLNIPHISTYSLIIEDRTLLKINNYQNIEEDVDYNMYKYIEKTLEDNGYIHYEISNYAKSGYESKHNLVYWNNEEYYGFGLSSTSYINNIRMVNTRNLNKYFNHNYLDEENYEDIDVRMENEIMLGFRKMAGIDLNVFKKKYNIDLEKKYDISSLISDGYLIKEGNLLRINKKFIYISNEILLKIFG